MTDYREMTVDELREEGKRRDLSGIWDMKKDELIEALSQSENGETSSGNGEVDLEARSDSPATRRGSDPSTSMRIVAGQTLYTNNPEVIRRWAEDRGAEPATAPGTEHGDRFGVMRFDFPDYGGEGLEKVSWDDWFGTFAERDLVFIYQEHKANRAESNFFRLESPTGRTPEPPSGG